MAQVLDGAVSPTVRGAVGAVVGTVAGIVAGGRGDGIGTVVTGAVGGGSETLIGIGLEEVDFEGRHGLGGCLFFAPFSAGDIEQSGCFDNVVAHAGDCVGCRGFSSGSGELDSIFQLGEKTFDRDRRMPRSSHFHQVAVELVLGDDAIVAPEVCEEFKASNIAVAKSLMGEGFGVNFGGCVEQEVAKGIVSVVVNSKGVSSFEVATVGFSNLRSSEVFMVGKDGEIDWGNERDVGDFEEGCWRGGQGQESEGCGALVGVDRGCIAIQFFLSAKESFIVRFGGVLGDLGQDGTGKGGTGGDGGAHCG